MALPWDKGMHDRLVELLSDNPPKTTPQIADILSKESGLTVSRNAVIGRMTRYKLKSATRQREEGLVVAKKTQKVQKGSSASSLPPTVTQRRPPPPTDEQKREHLAMMNFRRDDTTGETPPPDIGKMLRTKKRQLKDFLSVHSGELPLEDAIDKLFGNRPKKARQYLLDVPHGCCRWLMGEPKDRIFCCRPVGAYSKAPYCGYHQTIASSELIGHIRPVLKQSPTRITGYETVFNAPLPMKDDANE